MLNKKKDNSFFWFSSVALSTTSVIFLISLRFATIFLDSSYLVECLNALLSPLHYLYLVRCCGITIRYNILDKKILKVGNMETHSILFLNTMSWTEDLEIINQIFLSKFPNVSVLVNGVKLFIFWIKEPVVWYHKAMIGFSWRCLVALE